MHCRHRALYNGKPALTKPAVVPDASHKQRWAVAQGVCAGEVHLMAERSLRAPVSVRVGGDRRCGNDFADTP